MENPKKGAEDDAKAEAEAVAEFVRKEVSDWDDEVKCRARFKVLSGQRSDWDPIYLFWRDLIIKVARHLRILVIRPSRVQFLWFRVNGLYPLCLGRVLVEMQRAGDLLPQISSTDQTPAINRISHLFRKSIDFVLARPSSDDSLALDRDYYALSPLLEERALEAVKILSENHWTVSCVITMKKLQDVCQGSKEEALAILTYLSAQGKATRLVINKTERIEGVKVCLAPGAVSKALEMDYSVLHLIWTAERLEQQLSVIDQRYQETRRSALDSLKSGNKRVALRYARELKKTSLCRENCSSLFERVENVIQVIAEAESSKMVSEAIKHSSRAINENQINLEEVENCLQEIDESILSLKQIDNVLESTPAYTEIDEEDIEDEFSKLQLEINLETSESRNVTSAAVPSATPDLLADALTSLNLEEKTSMASVTESSGQPVDNRSKQKTPIAM